MSATAIEKIEHHARSIRDGHEKVSPGMAFKISEASSVGDGVWQGDLGVEIVAQVPEGYVRVAHPQDADRQLVTGNTQGAKHCLDALDGVELYRPTDWGRDGLLAGPCFVLTKARTITHPTHGDVVIPAGFTVLTRYQREWDAEQRRERRSLD